MIDPKIRDEMDESLENIGVAQGEIESLLTHWGNEYNITRKTIKPHKSQTPEQAAEALQVAIDYIVTMASWKEGEGFTEVPKKERYVAYQLSKIKRQILGLEVY